MDGLSVAKIRTSLVQCLRGYSVNGFGLQRKKDAGGPYWRINRNVRPCNVSCQVFVNETGSFIDSQGPFPIAHCNVIKIIWK